MGGGEFEVCEDGFGWVVAVAGEGCGVGVGAAVV
jgi:hypothetical protein